MSAKYSGIDGYVGNTPLIRLRRLSELTGCEILGKAEFMNPAGSVKDRAAYGIITDAEQQGRLKPGATIVEGTAGNTGIGLAVIGRARGYRTVIVIPNNQSPEKMHLLRTLRRGGKGGAGKAVQGSGKLQSYRASPRRGARLVLGEPVR